MAEFNRSYNTFYQSAIVRALVPYLSYLTLKYIMTFWIRGHSKSSDKIKTN